MYEITVFTQEVTNKYLPYSTDKAEKAKNDRFSLPKEETDKENKEQSFTQDKVTISEEAKENFENYKKVLFPNQNKAEKQEEIEQIKHKKPGELTEKEKEIIERLKKRDKEVRQHEHKHKAIAGRHAQNIQYSYITGPDNKRYAIEGQVPMDVSPERTPEETLEKALKIKQAVGSVDNPSVADRQIIARADQIATQARREIIRRKQEKVAESIEDKR